MSGLGLENGGLALAHSLTRGVKDALHGFQVAWALLVQLAVEARRDDEIADL